MQVRLVRLATICLVGLIGDPAFADTCSTQDLQPAPKWISTVEFQPANGAVLIVDPSTKTLFSYHLKTREMRKVPTALPPTSLTRIEGGLLLQSGARTAVPSRDFKRVQPVAVGESGPEVGSLYSNWTTRGSTFVGFGSARKAGIDVARPKYELSRGFQLGFVKGKISTRVPQFRNVTLLEATEDNDLYLLGFPYFASNDTGLFYLRMIEGRASIQRVRESGAALSEELAAFPEYFRVIPRLNAALPPAERYAEIEQKALAAGLFGQGEFLYVLTREPNPTGEGTQWLLFQIHPSDKEPRGAVRLPTTAHHLSIAVTPKEWVLFERGVVRAWGDQDIARAIRIPTEWISSPENSPLNVNSPKSIRCSRTQSKATGKPHGAPPL